MEGNGMILMYEFERMWKEAALPSIHLLGGTDGIGLVHLRVEIHSRDLPNA
jgi:2-phosphoglycerate kinase